MKKTQTSKPSFTSDFVSVLAVFLILVVQTQYLPRHEHQPWDYGFLYLLYFLGKMGIPLFIMHAGTLAIHQLSSKTCTVSSLVKRAAVPWLVWATLYFFVVKYADASLQGIVPLLTEFRHTLFSTYWLIPMVLILYACLPVLAGMVKHYSTKQLMFILIIWFIFTSIVPALTQLAVFPVYYLGVLSKAVYYVGYFLLGYVISSYLILPLSKKWLFLALMGTGVLSITLADKFIDNSDLFSFFVHEDFSPVIVIGSSLLFTLLQQFQGAHIRFQAVLRHFSATSYGVLLGSLLISALVFDTTPEPLIVRGNIQLYVTIAWITKVLVLFVLTHICVWLLTKLVHIKHVFN